MYHTIELEERGQVTTVWLNRPDVRNAFNPQMIADLTNCFRQLATSSARVVILAGRGKSFSAGADVNWMRESLAYSPSENVEDAGRMSDMFETIKTCPNPVIARVHGAALGGGMGLIAACDIVIAEEEAVFGFTEAKLGIIPAVISRFTLPKIGESWARALYLTAERFNAELARHIGLVHWIAPAEQLDAVVAAKVDEIAGSGPAAVAEAKSLIARMLVLEPDEVREFTAKRIADVRTGEEGQRGLQAFLEKRPPSWQRPS